MRAKLFIIQTKRNLDTGWFEATQDQKNYIINKYKDLSSNTPFSTSYYIMTIIRIGEYKRILDFLSEKSIPGTLLYERSLYNKKNDIKEEYIVEYLQF